MLCPSMPEEIYHADPCDAPSLSASLGKLFLTESPAHVWTKHPRLNPYFQQNNDPKFDLGKVVHKYALEGSKDFVVIGAPDWRTKAAKEERDEANAAGKTAILSRQWLQVREMRDVLVNFLEDFAEEPHPLTDGAPEQTLIWEEDGIWCRARLDWLHDGHMMIDDYKTTNTSANPDAFSRQIYGLGYDIQASFYLRGSRKVLGTDPRFRFVVQEVTPPYAVSVIGLGPDMLAVADRKVDWIIGKWRECITTGKWPGYPGRTCYPDMPGWAEKQWLEFELGEEDAES